MSEEVEILKNIASKLDQLLKWARFAGMQQLRDILAKNLADDTSMLIYECSDGERSSREVARLAGVKSNVTVTNYWKKWSKLGIIDPSPKYRGRFQRICSLEEIGLTVPPIPQTSATTEEKEPTKEDTPD